MDVFFVWGTEGCCGAGVDDGCVFGVFDRGQVIFSVYCAEEGGFLWSEAT